MYWGNAMSENQNIEWKQSWRDEYLKWVCGFANGQGGKIYIGVNDNGSVIGIDDHEALLEILPTKIRDLLGVMCDINHLHKDGLHYIEIVVQPYSVPLSLRGRYYYRSGSSKVELTGVALNEFLLKKNRKKLG